MLPTAIAKVKDLDHPPSPAVVTALAKRLKLDPNSELVKQKVAEFQGHVARAESALADVTLP